MTSPLVETKLYAPQPGTGLVARPRLAGRRDAKLTLVSAPAGFGKTTMLAGWFADRPVAWLSLDESDRQPAAFWTYTIVALQRVVPGVGESALALLRSARPPIEAVLGTVVNELAAATTGDVFLVLDDYHLVDGPEIQAGLTFLLEHLPPRVHLVISTRADPALPLARLRARGELVEVRAAELRFTPAEAAAYLNDVTGLGLTPDDIAVLAGRTEGWIAALQLAALSMHGRDDVAGFIEGFAGDDRYIVDYLVEEVLGRQPADVRRFLLDTSVLDRLSGPLCDAVTARPGARAMLENLDRANLFVVRLDDRRRWYRYHHLFADVLRAHLADEDPDRVAGLHRRASDWYEQHGEHPAAVRHALAAGDVDHAAGLVELAIPALRQSRQEATIRAWIDVLPDAVVRLRPVLALGFVGALMSGNEFDGVPARLDDVERMLTAGPPPPGMVVVDTPELARLPGAIEMYRAALALIRGDPAATIGHARRAVEVAGAEDHLVRAAASALLGLALWTGGDLSGADLAYTASVDGLRRAGHLSDVLGCSITLADIRITQGRLDDARRTFEDGLHLAAGTTLRGIADMHVGLSRIAYERDDLPAATGHLRRAEDLGEHTWLPQNAYRWRVALARIRAAEGDPDGALELLDQAQRVYVGDFSPDVRPIPALKARLLTRMGRAGEARVDGLSADDEPAYLREFEHVTLARVLLARRDPSVNRLLRRLGEAAEAGGRTGSLIEILVLRALAGDDLAALERALILAEPQGYVRVFTDEGPPMTALLRRVARRPAVAAYVHRLLGAGREPAPAGPALSERELDVLRLLGSDLTGPEMARQLSVSLNTLRTHTKNIYTKLGVTNRRAAVRRAAELRLNHHMW